MTTPALAPARTRTPLHWAQWLYALGFVVILGVFSLCSAETAIAGAQAVGLFTLVMTPWVLVGAALVAWRLWERRSDSTAPQGRSVFPAGAWTTLLAGLALFGYAAVTLGYGEAVILVNKSRTRTHVPLSIRVVPLLNSVLALLAGFLLMALTPRRRRLRLLWWVAVALVPLSLMGWARVGLTEGRLPPRLWTQLGGAAVYPVALALGLAVSVAAIGAQFRTRQSSWLAVVLASLLLLTGSRGALLIVIIFAVLVLLRLGRKHTGLGARLASVPPVVYIVGSIAITVALLISPVLSRLDDRSAGRLMTWRVGIHALGDDAMRWLLGVGYGRIWPWYAYESGWQPLPWRSRMPSEYGVTLYHSHSLYLAVLAELGIIGALLLALVIWPLLARWLTGGSPTVVVLAAASLASLVGFNFDLLLFKNASISMLWWAVVFGCLLGGDPPPTQKAVASRP